MAEVQLGFARSKLLGL
jgi:hypothetical protein